MQIENAGQRSSEKICANIKKLCHRETFTVEKSLVSLCIQCKDEAITQDQCCVQLEHVAVFWDVRNRFELCVGSQAGCSRSLLFLLLLVSVGKGQVVIRLGLAFCLLYNWCFSSFVCIIHLGVCWVVFPRSSSSFRQSLFWFGDSLGTRASVTRRNMYCCLLSPLLHDLLCFHFLASHALVSSITTCFPPRQLKTLYWLNAQSAELRVELAGCKAGIHMHCLC